MVPALQRVLRKMPALVMVVVKEAERLKLSLGARRQEEISCPEHQKEEQRERGLGRYVKCRGGGR